MSAEHWRHYGLAKNTKRKAAQTPQRGSWWMNASREGFTSTAQAIAAETCPQTADGAMAGVSLQLAQKNGTLG